MKLQLLFLTFGLMDIILMSAASPTFAPKLHERPTAICGYINDQGTDKQQTELKLKNAHYYLSWFRRKCVHIQQNCSQRIHTYLNNHCRTQKFKILSSGLFGLVYSFLMQCRMQCKSGLREWYMQNQDKDLQITSIRWVTVEKCAELVGWTKDAINSLRVKGKIRMDVHWTKRNGRIFIDMAAFQQWIGTGK